MDSSVFLKQLDELFAKNEREKIEPFLLENLEVAIKEDDSSTAITILNEMIGFYRETSQKEKSAFYGNYVIKLMKNMGLEGTVPYATSLLNVANACRAAGEFEQSKELYNEVFRIYDNELDPKDFRYASLNNNLSLLFQEMGQFEESVECLKKALKIVEMYPNARYELAVTYANLGMSLLRIEDREESFESLERSIRIFDELMVRDSHYGAALSALAEIYVKRGKYEEAISYYETVLPILEAQVGKAESYLRVEENLRQVKMLMEMECSDEHDGNEVNEAAGKRQEASSYGKKRETGMELAESFYLEYGVPMLAEKFTDYADQIAVGLAGEGSQCFGFDDELSKDHDFGPEFCLWVTDELYEKIGRDLQNAYDELPEVYHGIKRQTTKQGRDRVGVCTINGFFERILGMNKLPETESEWLYVDENSLAAAVNGKIFRDALGKFTEARNYLLKGYPRNVWLRKMAQEAVMFAQTLQYNYPRSMKRGDDITAGIIFYKGIEHAMRLAYLLKKVYAPYYKWQRAGLRDDIAFSTLLEELHKLFIDGSSMSSMEKIVDAMAQLFLSRMKEQRIIEDIYKDEFGNPELFLARYGEEISMEEKNRLVDEIVSAEWKAFDEVKNEGGRAGCQDDWDTFSIMRKSQYLTWEMSMLRQYLGEFQKSVENGWNPVTEKYARMMESTAPEKYEEMKSSLPEINLDKKRIIEEIVKIQVGWMEGFAKEYPKLASSARNIHTYEDTPYDTSYETYLRGEISTYSDEMLMLYGRFVVKLLKEGRNLAEMTMEESVQLYGYSSLEDAERYKE